MQIIEFKEGTFSAKILIDPSGIEIMYLSQSMKILSKKNLMLLEDGTYKLIVESTSIEDTQVFGAYRPCCQMSGKKTIVDVVSISILLWEW